MSRIINDMSFHLVLKNCRPHLVCRCQKQNSKFIPITTGLDPEKHTFKKVENFTVDSPSKNQLIDKVWDLQTIKRIKYWNLKIEELGPPQGQWFEDTMKLYDEIGMIFGMKRFWIDSG